ncbi:hypothetical protein E27107_70006 [Elizabethkingia anophelis]|nr:hypothetical protein E18064_190012 [Elizabethkingia anophelis]CDN79655.1 hypothetical protein E27107_70006 [Elizabethkingia anophelis]
MAFVSYCMVLEMEKNKYVQVRGINHSPNYKSNLTNEKKQNAEDISDYNTHIINWINALSF